MLVWLFFEYDIVIQVCFDQLTLDFIIAGIESPGRSLRLPFLVSASWVDSKSLAKETDFFLLPAFAFFSRVGSVDLIADGTVITRYADSVKVIHELMSWPRE